jgi:hypothetical protein
MAHAEDGSGAGSSCPLYDMACYLPRWEGSEPVMESLSGDASGE